VIRKLSKNNFNIMKTKILFFMVAAAIVFAGCKKDEEDATMSVSPASVSAVVTEGTYAIAVTSNVAWTAAVDAAATWCTASPASGNANGTVTVNVAENLTVETRSATVTVSAGSLEKTVTVTQDAAAPILEVDRTTIDATVDAASYDIVVTSNMAWTAAVDAAATWCTVSPASGSSDATVTVNVEFYAEVGNRAATVTFTAGALVSTVTVTQQRDTPPDAYSAQTWTFGDQVWSDRIIATPSTCAQTATLTTANYTTAEYKESDGRYYYSWTCVIDAQATLCPSPWRVPSQDDFNTLVSNTTSSTLDSDWGLGGYANGSAMSSVDSQARYWSSTEVNTNNAYNLYYSGGLGVNYTLKYYGFQVRCVK
jgi:hypothetical protein